MATKANTSTTTATRYIPVAQFDQYHAWPSPQSLRNRIHAARRDGDADFLNCIMWVGGRVLVDEQAFLRWLEGQANTHTP